MPRHPQYERNISASQLRRQYWADPANAIGLGNQIADDTEREQYHARQAELEQERLDQQHAEADRKFAQHEMDQGIRNRKDTQAIGAFAEISDLDPAAPDYRMRVAGITQKYPLGMLDKGVQSLLKDYHTANDHSVSALRKAHNLDDTVDPRDHTIVDPQTGAVQYDHNSLHALGQTQAAGRSADVAALRAAQAKAYQDALGQNARVTIGPTGVSATLPADTAKKEQEALVKERFRAAEARRQKAMSTVFGKGFMDANQKAAAQAELEAANAEFGSAYHEHFGAPWQPQLPTAGAGRGEGESAAVRSGDASAVAPNAEPAAAVAAAPAVPDAVAQSAPSEAEVSSAPLTPSVATGAAGTVQGAPAEAAPVVTPTAPAAPVARVPVISPDGKRGTLRADQLEAAIAAGYKPAQ